MKKILLTGSSGFIGAALKIGLEKNNYEIIEYDIKIGKDILNLDQLELHIKEVDLVYHNAAQCDLAVMLKDPKNTFDGVNFNIASTHNIAYLCSKYKKKLIFSSTDSVYGGSLAKLDIINENSIASCNNLYGTSKFIGENIIQGYNLEYITLRYSAVYGENTRLSLNLGSMIDKALKNQTIYIYGDGKQEKIVIYLEDLIDACVKAVQKFDQVKNNIFNLSYMEKISQLQLAQDIIRISNSKSKIAFIDAPNKLFSGGIISNEKACSQLDWSPKYSWIDGITKTIGYYKSKNIKDFQN